MPRQHTEPCRECPFRKKSLKGYIGGHKHVNEIMTHVHYDGKFPCHLSVNRLREKDEDLEFDEACDKAAQCAGSLAYANNVAKSLRDPAARKLATKIGKRDDVFQTPMEMQLHHAGEVSTILPPGMMFGSSNDDEGDT